MNIQDEDEQEDDMNVVNQSEKYHPAVGIGFALLGSVIGWVVIYYAISGLYELIGSLL